MQRNCRNFFLFIFGGNAEKEVPPDTKVLALPDREENCSTQNELVFGSIYPMPNIVHYLFKKHHLSAILKTESPIEAIPYGYSMMFV